MGDEDRHGFGAVCGWPQFPWSGGPDGTLSRVPFWLGMGMFFYTPLVAFVPLRGRSQTNLMDFFCRIGIRSGKIPALLLVIWKPDAADSVSTIHFRTG